MPLYDEGTTLAVNLLSDVEGASALAGRRDSGFLDHAPALGKASFEILHAVKPFTRAVVLKARLLHSLDALEAGSAVLLKIYDRRFAAAEDRATKGQAWTEIGEHVARERWLAIANRNRQCHSDSQAEAGDGGCQEEHWHQESKTSFFTEVDAYERLHAYQGITIPIFYHSFRLTEDSTAGQTIPLDPAHMPHGIMIQYLDGAVTAADVDPQIWPDLSKSTRNIMSLVSMLPTHGIIHNDIRSDNLMFGKNYAMVIDFGGARLRDASTSDADWQEDYEGHDDIGAARWILHKRGLRAESPIPPFDGDEAFLESQSFSIRNHDSSWIDRWYHTLLDENRINEIIKDRELRANTVCYKKKDEVKEWQVNKKLDYEGFQRPRPGSPDWQGLNT